jgi:hypothetical protein
MLLPSPLLHRTELVEAVFEAEERADEAFPHQVEAPVIRAVE